MRRKRKRVPCERCAGKRRVIQTQAGLHLCVDCRQLSFPWLNIFEYYKARYA